MNESREEGLVARINFVFMWDEGGWFEFRTGENISLIPPKMRKIHLMRKIQLSR